MADKQATRRRRVGMAAKIGLGLHIGVYVLVNLMFVVVNLLTTPEQLWCLWSILGWGIGVMCHGISIFSRPRQMPTMAEIRARRKEKESE